MALETTYTTEHGIEVPGAYLVITEVNYIKGGNTSAILTAYRDLEARNEGLMPLFMRPIVFEYDINLSENIITQAYLTVKSLPEFQAAQDV